MSVVVPTKGIKPRQTITQKKRALWPHRAEPLPGLRGLRKASQQKWFKLIFKSTLRECVQKRAIRRKWKDEGEGKKVKDTP